ncbi:MAG: LysR family transcriptional regulator [Sphingobium sp.]
MPYAIGLTHLRHVLLVSRHRSFRRAAATLGLRPSTVSRRIRYVELRLGVKLFERSNKGIQATPAGEALAFRLDHAIGEIDRLLADAIAAGRGTAGALSIGFCASLSAGNMRACTFDFAADHPDIHVSGKEWDRSALVEGVGAGAIDIAILWGNDSHEGMERRPFWSERIMVALPEGHGLAGREAIHWHELRDEHFLVMEHDPGPDVAALLIANLAAPGFRPSIEVQDISRENVLHAVSAGSHVTLALEASMGSPIPGVVLRELHGAQGPLRVEFAGLWRRGNRNPALQTFLRFVTRRYALPLGDDRP